MCVKVDSPKPQLITCLGDKIFICLADAYMS